MASSGKLLFISSFSIQHLKLSAASCGESPATEFKYHCNKDKNDFFNWLSTGLNDAKAEAD